ncbi:hypothetical protein IT568_04185 [bacterium]|nr:hypothetical protein [bacterium]
MRLLVKIDFDGIICAFLLKKVLPISEIRFTTPLEILSKTISSQKNDIVANLPYLEGCEFWFDHHATNSPPKNDFKGIFRINPSAASLVYEYFGAEKNFPNLKDLIDFTDRIDSGDLTFDEVLEPKNHVLVAKTIESKIYLERSQEFNLRLIELYEKTINPQEILNDPEVAKRVKIFLSNQNYFREMVKKHSELIGKIVVTDIRFLKNFPKGDRFFVYTLFPEATLALKAFHTQQEPNHTILSVSHNIFNRVSKVHVGDFCKKYNGGGHEGAAIARFERTEPKEKIWQIVQELNDLENASQ